ncbi:hypothetical protein JGU66_12980 [Myxococcaceae bacterium JPH2]|nr:hypothetical protein [Myxococcaceae bacterium JPH2]
MRLALVLLLSLAAPALAASPVEVARGHLKKGHLDEVLFALDGQNVSAEERAPAAAVLADASRAALAKKDTMLALQFSQMALRYDAEQPAALEVASRAYFAEKQISSAEDTCEKWLRVTNSAPAARLLRAEIASGEAEWSRVLTLLSAEVPASLAKPAQSKWRALRKDAAQQEASSKKARGQLEAMDAHLAAAQGAAADAPKSQRPETVAAAPSPYPIILYVRGGCEICRDAATFLTTQRVTFVQKDIGKDAAARDELQAKKQRAHVTYDGVPITDFGGRIVPGYESRLFKEELRLYAGDPDAFR